MRRRLRALTGERAFPVLVVVTVAALWVNVASGALVRVTGSGLGCPDWPLCNGRPTPAWQANTAIEYSNRIVALGVIVATLLLAVSAYRVRRGRDDHAWRLALAIGIGTFAQGPLGGITVLTDLHPIAVMSHFLLALLILAVAVVLALDERGWARDWGPRPGWVPAAAVALPVVTFALVVSGAVVTMSGTHPGGEDVERLWNLLDAAYVHVRVAVVFVAFLVALLYGLARLATPPRLVARLSWAFVALVAVQISLGEYQWRNHLPWWTVLLHVAVAALVWSCAVALARALLPRPPQSPRPPAEDRGETRSEPPVPAS